MNTEHSIRLAGLTVFTLGLVALSLSLTLFAGKVDIPYTVLFVSLASVGAGIVLSPPFHKA